MTGPKHTPGPWRWEVNRKSKTVELCGGNPRRGFGRYDKTVLSFKRWGMSGATPVFWFWQDGETWSEKPKGAGELAIPAPGRKHHADWFALIDHPDARLIAAAPDYDEAAREALAFLNRIEGHGYGGMADFENARCGLQLAIEKTDGRFDLTAEKTAQNTQAVEVVGD